MRRMHGVWLLLVGMVACSGEDVDDPGGSSGTGGTAGQGGEAGSAGTAGTGGAAGQGGTGGSVCSPPVFSDDCSKVTQFQCGFSVTCDQGTIRASWHHHHFCDGQEDIAEFQCTYPCPEACDGDYMDWPQDGAALVEAMCVGAGGAAGAAGAGGTGGSAGAAGSGGGTCVPPSFSTDCSEVTQFQCGIAPSCDGNVAKMSWHHHYNCNGQEEIMSFTCSYPCAANCDPDYMDWPADGQDFVSSICTD